MGDLVRCAFIKNCTTNDFPESKIRAIEYQALDVKTGMLIYSDNYVSDRKIVSDLAKIGIFIEDDDIEEFEFTPYTHDSVGFAT